MLLLRHLKVVYLANVGPVIMCVALFRLCGLNVTLIDHRAAFLFPRGAHLKAMLAYVLFSYPGSMKYLPFKKKMC